MNVLVIGSGARESALTWKLSLSAKVERIFVSPGNAGTSETPKSSNVSLDNFDAVVDFAKKNKVHLVVVGPEKALVDGLSDTLRAHGIKCFGPSAKASTLEASKAFSKAFMQRHGIPTAEYKSFTEYKEALEFVKSRKFPVVLKASGLASGKGVIVPESLEETLRELEVMMVKKPLGSAADEVVIEERLTGPEVSVLAFTDGHSISVMPAAQDHKRAFDNDQGPNTGGMGAYAPTPLATPNILSQIVNKILKPAVDGMRKEGRPYVGVIYAGTMVTENGVKCLEFNCRFGDPEAQAILPLLESDLVDIMEACVDGCLDAVDVKWLAGKYAVTVVAASGGYPGDFQTGKKITGLENVTQARVFHAGTKTGSEGILTSGGRVLSVTALGSSIKEALSTVYASIQKISFEGMFYRTDIAKKALEYLEKDRHLTYKDAGVDIDTADSLVDAIGPIAKATRRPGTDAEIGGFGGLFDTKAAGFKDPILVSGTDGVGTKLLIAQAVGKHDTIGIDLVAMSVNDVLVHGAEPLFFLDYFACGKLAVNTAKDVIKGIADGCLLSKCALIGGETAEMPGMYPFGKYDLAGFAVGAVERDQMLPKKLQVGNVLIGLASSGVHSNGFSLVRHIVESKFSYTQKAPFDEGKTLGEALLAPTEIYVRQCLPLIKNGKVLALAHITGGGLTENVPRFLEDHLACEFDLSSWDLPPVFQWLAKEGNITRDELIRTFNCGIGMVLAVESVAAVKELQGKFYVIGQVVQRTTTPVVYKNNWKNFSQ